MTRKIERFLIILLSACLIGLLYHLDFDLNNNHIVQYKQVEIDTPYSFIGEITAYTAGYESCGKLPTHPAYGITANGNKVKKGIIAVDTRVLPFGSIIYIEDIGIFTADDTGGDIKGNRIDIYMENLDDAIKFGRQYRKVIVLKKG